MCQHRPCRLLRFYFVVDAIVDLLVLRTFVFGFRRCRLRMLTLPLTLSLTLSLTFVVDFVVDFDSEGTEPHRKRGAPQGFCLPSVQ